MSSCIGRRSVKNRRCVTRLRPRLIRDGINVCVYAISGDSYSHSQNTGRYLETALDQHRSVFGRGAAFRRHDPDDQNHGTISRTRSSPGRSNSYFILKAACLYAAAFTTSATSIASVCARSSRFGIYATSWVMAYGKTAPEAV